MIPYFELEMDHDANAAYIQLTNSPVSKTVEVSQQVLVDLDEMNVAVGIEILSLHAEVPFSTLRDQFHIHSDVIAQLQMVQPTVSSFATFSTGTDGVSSNQSNSMFKSTLISH
ncbi:MULTISPECIES: DUF2283 domain-containing protein [Glutamicibacter]|uniref:DUF2283 domain-containing protein n=1 Tax=Glutamicibacter nicotianae TaxID=37929 RepID=A0ABQ0RLS7_GLUNI|nr:DUF2283 domain-containing protein [Glutamicibacter nicotianae]GEC12748.1 hypothetical protein ANI01nite_19510 [Glutamicibacter nicotianae]